MSTNTTFDRLLTSVMTDDAAGGDPEQAINQILSTTSRMRPLPRWLVLLKERPMRIQSRVAAGSPAYRRALVIGLVIALILAAAAALVAGAALLRPKAVPLPAPYGVARNGAFLYEVDGDIYSADAAGDHQVSIISGPTTDVGPVYSRDGAQFVFRRTADVPARDLLMVANADGTNVRPLTAPISGIEWVDWSPSGTKLVVLHVSERGGRVLSIVQTDAQAGLRTLDLGQVQPAGWVAWRPPEGQELIFRGLPGTSEDVALYSVGTDGTGLHAIVPPVTPSAPGVSTLADPEISADGSTIGYWSWGPNAAGTVDGWSHMRSIAGGQDRLVESYGGNRPKFSPDGKSVVGWGNGQLVVEPTDGSRPARPIGPKFSNEEGLGYDLSPDGTKVILVLTTRTLLIDLASGDSVATPQLIPRVPTWQRLAP